MSEKSVCSNCGKSMKDQWMVCKYCHQARWKRIQPYYVWGSLFLIFSWWALTQKIFPISTSENFVTLMLPIFGITFGLISIVMLLMAIIASLRGLTVKRIISEPMSERELDWNQIKSFSPLKEENPVIHMADQENRLTNQAQKSNLLPTEIEQDQTIFCLKCKYQNKPDAKKCNQCGTDLLPGVGIAERLGVIILTTILALISFGCGFLFFRYKPEFEGKDWIYLGGIILFGVLLFGFGLISAVRKVPLHERYSMRAKRHISLNTHQAIADFEAAINSAPSIQAFDYLLERAELFQKIGLEKEAKLDWQVALKNINNRLANLKPPYLELTKQRAEIYKKLNMQDEYSIEMLQYTLEKELTFKFKEDEVAKGFEEGIKKGTEENKRMELQQLRTEILKDHQYGIVGYCHKCKSVVDLNSQLKCSKDLKHKKITEIKPVLKGTD